MKCYVLLITLFLTNATIAQVKDSIGVEISKLPSPEKTNDLYEIRILNLKSDPICIMHSAYINLFIDPPQRLAIQNSRASAPLVSLHHAAQDTLVDYENTNPNYNAEAILPQQEIRFRILVPPSRSKKQILLEYLVLPDFSYRRFKQAIFQNAATWYQLYEKKNLIFDLP